MYHLVPVLAHTMGNHYPELQTGKEQIAKIIFEEESAFLKTLGKGLKMIEKMINDLRKEKKNILSGKIAFEMYDTFGFPVDLTQLILKENDMHLDLKGFEDEMKNQKDRSREDASTEAVDWIVVMETEGTEFTGYEKSEDEVRITKYRTVKIKGKQSCQLVFNKTPFYAESGGQVGDNGTITSGNEKVAIIDTVKENNLVIHIAKKLPSDPTVVFRASVDIEKRLLTANNHTATHLIHFALRSVLGNHVEQKGSLVTPDRLRFDFSHFIKLSREELSKVELLVNNMVREDHKSKITAGVSMEKAKSMGAMALFGEKYGETVRVVEFGKSIELCGGIHVESTGRMGIVKIVSEGAIAAGVRRIEAVTAAKAEEYINEKLNTLDEVASLLKSTGNISESVERLLSENNSLKKSVEKFQAQSVTIMLKELIDKAIIINGIKYISGQIETDSAEVLKNIAYQVRSSSENTVLVIGSESGGKASILVMISDNLVKEKNLNAVAVIKEIAGDINGGGGGQPFLATAGGKNPAGIRSALKKAGEYIRKI
jgi:alanyl-tRNA synthetase